MKTYTVRVNRQKLEVNKVRVSAMPFNKVFDGKQRSFDQTEEAYFVTADIEESSILEISVNESFEDYEIRPLEFDLSDKRVENTVTLKIDEPMHFTFEPDGFHNALHVFMNPPSVRSSGDVIYYGKGEHTAGLIWLESGQTLYLEEGARVYGVIFAKDAEDIKIMGRGIIDSSPYRRGDDFGEDGREIYDDLIKHGMEKELAEAGYICSNMVLYNCKNVYVEGITLLDSMFWSLIVRNHCENIVIDNIKIIGQWRYNSDGIDICASKNVTVKNSFIRSFDDCFVARAPYLKDEIENVENIVVKNCVMWCDWGKSLEIWCGNKPCAIRNITFENNWLIRLNAIAISIATWYGSNHTVVENIKYDNVFINGDSKERHMDIMFESENNRTYINSHKHIPILLSLDVEKLGKSLGNQRFIPATNEESFSIVYKNIAFNHVRYTGPKLEQKIVQPNSFIQLTNIVAENSDFEI